MMQQAERYVAKYSDITDLMVALDNNNIESNQDWEHETTVWTFVDGSSISISGTDIEVSTNPGLTDARRKLQDACDHLHKLVDNGAPESEKQIARDLIVSRQIDCYMLSHEVFDMPPCWNNA